MHAKFNFLKFPYSIAEFDDDHFVVKDFDTLTT